MKLLTVLGVVLLITTGTWAYSRNCAKGPEYWCRDASTAEACGAVRHCEQTVWRENRNNKPSMTREETAEMLCNVLVQASKKLLDENLVKADSIKEYLRDDCAKLPKENNLIENCQLAVDIYLSDILRHIQSGIESTKICPIIQRHDAASSFVPKPKVNNLASNATCVLCEFVLHLVEAAASANASEQELIHIFEQVCTQMPVTIRTECKNFVDQYAADIIALLVREIDPAKVCELIKICPKPKNVAFLTKPSLEACGVCEYVSTYITSGYPIENVCTHFSTENNIRQQCEILVYLYKPNMCPELPLCFDETKSEQPNANPLECSLCKFVVSYVDTVIQSNRSEAAIEAALEKVCTILPHSLNSSCVQFVENYGPVLVQLLEVYVTPDQVCAAIKACTNASHEITPFPQFQRTQSKSVPPNSPQCTLCEFIINYVEKSVGDNRSAAAVEAALEKVCKILPSSVRPNCTSFVDKFGLVIALLIAKNETAAQVCNFLKVCNNGTQEIAPLEPVPIVQTRTVSVNSPQCTLCEFIINYVEKSVGDNRSAAAVEAALEKVCKILPSSIRPNCTSFVDKFGLVIALLIAKNETAAEVCNFLKVCNNGTQEIAPVKPVPVVETRTAAVNSVECTLCEFIINYVEKAVGDNRSAAAIDAALEKVCNVLPSSIRHTCTSFVDKFGAVIALLIAKNQTAAQVCDFIKVCHNGTQEIAPVELVPIVETRTASVNSVECTLCEFIINYVEKAVGDNRSAAAIDAALEKVCNVLPSSIRHTCTSFVDKFGAVIALLIAKNQTAAQVCDFIKVCHNGTQEIAPVELVPVVETRTVSVNSPQCTLCEFIINYVEKSVGDNRSAAAVEAALEKVCKILPSSIRPNCTSFVDKFGLVIALLIAKNETAAEVCNFLKVCNNGTQEIAPIKPVPIVQTQTVSVNSPQCTLCEFIINYVEKSVGDNRSAAAVEAALEKVCKILPSSIRPNCTSFVDKFGLVIALLIAKNETAAEVCNFLKVCNNGTQEIAPAQPVPVVETRTAPVNSVECTLCEFIINYVEKAVGDNRSAAAIDAALEKVCNVLPSSIRHTCTSFVDKFGAVIALLIAKNQTAAQVCDFIKVCHNGTQETASVEPVPIVETRTVSVNSPQCTLCEFIINYVEKSVGDNRSAAAVEAALEKVCKILPSSVRPNCTSFVDKFGLVIALLIAKNETAAEVCNFLKVCNNGTQEIRPKLLDVSSAECSVCKYVVSYVAHVIADNKSEAAVEAALEKVCTIVPHSFNKSCVQFVVTYGPKLVELIEKYDDPVKVCDALKLCNNGTEAIAQVSSQILMTGYRTVETLNCSLCKFVVSYVDDATRWNKSKAAIQSAVKMSCFVLPQPLSQPCVKFIDSYGPILVEYIPKYNTSLNVCIAANVCDNNTWEALSFVPEELKQEQPSVNSPQCSLCKLVVSYLELIVENNKTEAAIEAALEKVCTILPSDKKAECVQFIDTYGAKLVALLEKFGTPKLVCEALGLCLANKPAIPSVESVGSTQCTLCKYVVAYVDAVIQTNRSEAAIDSALEKVCTILPHSLNKSCVEFIDTHGPDLIEYIAKYETPAEVCDALKACKNGTDVAKPVVPQIQIPSVKDTVECTVCKYVISFINVLIESNATEQEIEKGLDVVCKLLPAASHPKCLAFVQTYGPIIPELIAELDDPNVICAKLGLCKKSDDQVNEIPTPQAHKLRSLPCNLCQYLVNYLDAIIQSNSTETRFEHELEKACKILPNTKMQSECKIFVDLYGTDLIKLLVELGNPKTVCQELGICDK